MLNAAARRIGLAYVPKAWSSRILPRNRLKGAGGLVPAYRAITLLSQRRQASDSFTRGWSTRCATEAKPHFAFVTLSRHDGASEQVEDLASLGGGCVSKSGHAQVS